MSAKRALVVDDSKSARAFLSRLLEKHHLDVDTAESAEDAIEYLNRHRPDVIFMDHLMPGMDGFQAVQAIKNNPLTATIPILMYTSQQGELYLGQARALGAMGVLPKQIQPADVSKVLHQLKLAEDRRGRQPQQSFTPFDALDRGEEGATVRMLVPRAAGEPAESAAAPAEHPAHELQSAAGDATRVLRQEIAELRHALAEGLEQQAGRIQEELRRAIRDAQPLVAEPVSTARDWRGLSTGSPRPWLPS